MTDSSTTNHFPKSHELELNYFMEGKRQNFGMRLREALKVAIEQKIIEDASEEALAHFIEQSLIQRLGGIGGVTGLIQRNIERMNRKERLVDALNPKLWSINSKFELEQDKGADY